MSYEELDDAQTPPPGAEEAPPPPGAALLEVLKRLPWAALMSLPVLLLENGTSLAWVRELPPAASGWMQWVWSCPVLFWAGLPLWRQLLGAVTTGLAGATTLPTVAAALAWLYSTGALLAAPGAEQPLLFDSAVLLTLTALLVRLVLLRAAAEDPALDALAALQPETATLVEGHGEKILPAAEAPVGALVRVPPGARLPVDGVVTSGRSHLDETALLGPSDPRPVEKGARVLAGTANGRGALTIKVEQAGDATLLAQIHRMLQQASAGAVQPAPLRRQWLAWLAPAALLLSTLVFLLWWRMGPAPSLPQAVLQALNTLAAACPAALALAAPLALRAGLFAAQRQGVVFSSARALAALAAADTLCINKSGLLTEGSPTVVEVAPLEGTSENDLLTAAAAVESLHSGPLAEAILRAARLRHLPAQPASEYQDFPGGGVLALVAGREVFVGRPSFLEAQGVELPAAVVEKARRMQETGHTVLVVVINEQPVGFISLADKLREEAPAEVEDLRAEALRVALLTGDGDVSTRRLLEPVKLDAIHTGLTAADKLAWVRTGQTAGEQILCVGPASGGQPLLEQADAGVSLGRGPLAPHGVTALAGGLEGVLTARRQARTCAAAMRSNVLFATGCIIIGALVCAVLKTPLHGALPHSLPAAALMLAGLLGVGLNSLRLRRR